MFFLVTYFNYRLQHYTSQFSYCIVYYIISVILHSFITSDSVHNSVLFYLSPLVATQATDEELERVAECLGISAVIIYDLRLSRTKGYVFKWEDILSFTGDTGPFLQITHARLCRLVVTLNVTGWNVFCFCTSYIIILLYYIL